MLIIALFAIIANVVANDMASTRLLGLQNGFRPGRGIAKLVSAFDSQWIPLGLDTLENVPAVRRASPGRIRSASFHDVRTNFINAYMPLCDEADSLVVDCICKQTYPHIDYVEDTQTESVVLVAINAKFQQIVVSYRITVSLQNWIDNIDLPLVAADGMPQGVRIHRGFDTLFRATHREVRAHATSLLDNPRYENHTLLITGYSLGGALAQVSAPHWAHLLRSRNDTRRIQLISYSPPRVGNRAFAEYVESLAIPFTRYTNQNDLVSHIPGRKAGYVHAGAEVYGSTQNGIYSLRHCSQAYDEDPSCLLGTFAAKSPVPHAYPLGKFIPLPPYC